MIRSTKSIGLNLKLILVGSLFLVSATSSQRPVPINADTVDGYHASNVPTADTLLALGSDAKIPPSAIQDGYYPNFDADSVDGYDASGTPAPNTLLALDGSGQFSNAAIPQGPGSGLDADTLDGYEALAFAMAGHGHEGAFHPLPNPVPEYLLTGGGFKWIPGANYSFTSGGGPVFLIATGMVRPNASGSIVVVSIIAADTEVGGGVAFTRYPWTLIAIIDTYPGQEFEFQVQAAFWGTGDAYVYVKSMYAIELGH